MNKLVICVALCFGVATTASALDLQVTNKSKTSIHHLYLSGTDTKAWGPDQLGKDVVDPGEDFTLSGIEKGDYDVKVVTENDQECEVDGADFHESKQWIITEKMLAKCE